MKKGKIKIILEDHWHGFLKIYENKIRSNTFGRDLKWNPHVHMMVTEGGKGNITEWRHIRYISYESLRKRWQKILLDEITNISGNTKEVKLIKNKLYKEKVKGFYVHAKTEIKSAKIAAKYVGRYVGRPAIAESRILKYDGKNVTYKYTRHEDNKVIVETVHVYEFIKRIIRHIPEKNFKMIRYFGIYSRRSKCKVNICTSCGIKENIPKEVVEYFDEMDQSNINEPPCFSCEKCGGIMRPKKYTGVYGIKY